MKSLVEEWDKFFKQHPTGGPWDYEMGFEKLQDDHVVDFIKYYNFEKNLKVLDCGCADGRNSEYLINEGFEVTGVDFSQTVIERTQKRLPKGKFLTGDVRKLDKIEENSFDFLIDAGALHVNYPQDTISIIKEYHRILKPSGKMFIRVFNKEDDTPNPIFTVNKDLTMPVFGYSEFEFSNHIKNYFNVKHKIYDSLYGSHGQGCNYYYLERKSK
jgi:ubiquinone/menaquinone biosynthesis C-methylase UbiE|tara:strand:+ start:318 stop:959 length:642 start_codon:yes stop_codon:yes gene_type:complete